MGFFMLHSLVPFSTAGLNILHSTRNDDLLLRLSGPAHSLATVPPPRACGMSCKVTQVFYFTLESVSKVHLNRKLAVGLIYLLRLRVLGCVEGWRVRMADRDLLAQ